METEVEDIEDDEGDTTLPASDARSMASAILPISCCAAFERERVKDFEGTLFPTDGRSASSAFTRSFCCTVIERDWEAEFVGTLPSNELRSIASARA